jgi:DNA topoisomerase I
MLVSALGAQPHEPSLLRMRMARTAMTEKKHMRGKSSTAVITDPQVAAKAAGLRYVTDTSPGMGRQRAGKGFTYLDVYGRPMRDPQALQRIRSLGIPPAWTKVWICPIPQGHLQATGYDAKGRKQYRYHPRWREVRDETKYGRMLAFGEALPLIRKQVEHDLALPGLPRAKVLATALRLLETTLIRVGNEEYVRANRSFGLTTLRDRHVDIAGATLRFHFRGKSGKEHTLQINDRRLARIVKRCQEIPGQELFQYHDDEGQRRTIDSADVNEYLRQITGQDFTSKDFRTWNGTVLAIRALQACGEGESAAHAKKAVVEAIKTVAGQLGNTPAICRKCYVHPAVIEAYLEGSLLQMLQRLGEVDSPDAVQGLSPEEGRVLEFLRQALAQEAHGVRTPASAL